MAEAEDNLPLFRETAVDAFSKRSYGRPIAKMPRSWLYFSIMLLAMVGTAVWFLATSSYSRKETTLGWLAPENGLVRISVSQGGLIERVLFEQGDFVEKGQATFVLSQDKKRIGGTGSAEDLQNKLQQEKAEIVTQIKIENASRISDVNTSKKILDQLNLEKLEIEHQINEQEDRVEITREIHSRFARLSENNTVSYLELQTQKERFSSQKQALAALRQIHVSIGREIINAQAIITKRPLDSQRTKSELQRRLIEISNQKTEIETLGGQAIQASISGTIATLEVQTGNTVYPQQLLASILPENSILFAEVYIPSRAIGFIQPEQSVRIMYAAFPHQRFGAAEGAVLEISNTVLRPEEIPSSIGLEEPAYKARIALSKQTMDGFGEVLALRPGMALNAEIILEKRSFLQWVLEPLRARRTN